jgi:hypothetical protein
MSGHICTLFSRSSVVPRSCHSRYSPTPNSLQPAYNLYHAFPKRLTMDHPRQYLTILRTGSSLHPFSFPWTPSWYRTAFPSPPVVVESPSPGVRAQVALSVVLRRDGGGSWGLLAQIGRFQQVKVSALGEHRVLWETTYELGLKDNDFECFVLTI